MSWLRRTRRAPASDAFAYLDVASEFALRDLRVTIDGRVLIERLSLTASAGRLWCVVGSNGVGKSTWFFVLAGLHSEDGGNVTLDDVALVDQPTLTMARCRAFLPQTLHDSFPITMYQAAMTGRHPRLVYWEWEGDADVRAVNATVSALHLQPLVQCDMRTLSGDERQRIAMAAVVAQEVRMLLLDEPIAHLDLHQQVAMLRLPREGCRKHGWLVIPAVHDLSLARRYAAHTLLMDGEGQTTVGTAVDVLTPEYCAHVLRISIVEVVGGRRTASISGDSDDD